MVTERKIHSHVLLMWIAVGSIVMMFAGFTSAYLVQKSQKNWFDISPPFWFYMSTVAIVASSVFVHVSKQKLKQKNAKMFKKSLWTGLILGILFVLFQFLGFGELRDRGLFLSGDNVASSFMYVIVGLHAFHVLGGLIAFVFLMRKYFSKTKLYYGENALRVFSIYWHFVDILWIYLLVFFLLQLN